MRWDGNDAGRGSNGLATHINRASTIEERATYTKWKRGVIVLYGAIFLIGGVIAIASYSPGDRSNNAVFARHFEPAQQR
jgi:hypothetical protein